LFIFKKQKIFKSFDWEEAKLDNNNNLRICEHCKEEVSYNARRCPYCGSLLNNVNIDADNNFKGKPEVSDGSEQTYSEYVERNEEPIRNEAIPAAESSDLTGNGSSYQQPEISQPGSVYSNNNYNRVSGKEDSSAAKYYFNSINDMDVYDIKPLSNKTKVFLTAISSFVPWLGQLIGIIAAIVYMNSEDDEDRRSFGRALLASSLIVFLITSFLILFTISAFSNIK
jgi:hypothetical protein